MPNTSSSTGRKLEHRKHGNVSRRLAVTSFFNSHEIEAGIPKAFVLTGKDQYLLELPCRRRRSSILSSSIYTLAKFLSCVDRCCPAVS